MQRDVDRNLLNGIGIASPCAVPWEGMAGDDTVRFCSLCSLNVYNISAMTTKDAALFLRNREPSARTCIKFYRRADGTIITKDCPFGLKAIRRNCFVYWQRIAAIVLFLLNAGTQARASDIGPEPSRMAVLRELLVSPVMQSPSENFNGNESVSGAILPGYKRWMDSLQTKVLKKWQPADNFDWSKTIVVQFKVNRNGRLSDLNLHRSSGTESYDRAALLAVKQAAPFDRLPATFGDHFDIQFTFNKNFYQTLKKERTGDKTSQH